MDSDNARYLLLLPEQTDLNSHSFPIKQETFQHKNMNNVGFYFTTDRIFICWVISKWTVLQLICLPIHWNCYLLNSNNFKFIYKKAISFTPLSSTHQACYWIVWKKKVKKNLQESRYSRQNTEQRKMLSSERVCPLYPPLMESLATAFLKQKTYSSFKY